MLSVPFTRASTVPDALETAAGGAASRPPRPLQGAVGDDDQSHRAPSVPSTNASAISAPGLTAVGVVASTPPRAAQVQLCVAKLYLSSQSCRSAPSTKTSMSPLLSATADGDVPLASTPPSGCQTPMNVAARYPVRHRPPSLPRTKTSRAPFPVDTEEASEVTRIRIRYGSHSQVWKSSTKRW